MGKKKRYYYQPFNWLIGADIETTNSEMLFGSVYIRRLNKSKESKYYLNQRIKPVRKYFATPDDFASIIKRYPDSIVVFHNAQFDVGFLKLRTGLLAKDGWHVDLTQSFNICSGDYRPYKMVIKGPYGEVIEVRDTLNYFSESLADLGGALGLEKLEFDADGESMEKYADAVKLWGAHGPPPAEIEELCAYCERDAEITATAYAHFNQFVIDQIGLPAGITISQTSRMLYEEHETGLKSLPKEVKMWSPYAPDWTYGDIDWSILKGAVKHYMRVGGRTECMWQGTPDERIYKYDFNSLYPSVMSEAVPIRPKLGTSSRIKDELTKAGNFFICRTKLPEDDVIGGESLWLDGHGLICPVGEVHHGIWSEWTRNWTDKFGVVSGQVYTDFEVDEIWPFEVYPAYEKFVAWLTEGKIKAQEAGNMVERKMFKILLNSLYGGLIAGKKAQLVSYVIDPDFLLYEVCFRGLGASFDYIKKYKPDLVDVVLRDTEELYELNLPHHNRIVSVFEEYGVDFPTENQPIRRLNVDGHVYVLYYKPIGDRVVLEAAEKVRIEKGDDYTSGANPPAGWFTAGIGRLKLNLVCRHIVNQGGTVYYVDTDSVYTNVQLPPEMVDDSKLGYLALEDVYEPGTYCFATNKVNGSKIDKRKSAVRGIKGGHIGMIGQEIPQTVFPKDTTNMDSKPPLIYPINKKLNVVNRKRVTEGGHISNPHEVVGARTLPPIGYYEIWPDGSDWSDRYRRLPKIREGNSKRHLYWRAVFNQRGGFI